jgi:putative flippase GtrA
MSYNLPQLIRFCVVGATVFAFDFSMLWVFHHFFPKLVAVSIAYIMGVTLHFCLNKWWVFQAGYLPAGSQVVRYLLNVAACWLCTVSFVWLVLHMLTGNVFIAKAIAIPPTTLLGFLLMRFFVFRKPSV